MVDCPQPNWLGIVPRCDPGAHDPAQYCPGPTQQQIYACPTTGQQNPSWVLCGDGSTWCDPFNPNLLCPPSNGEKVGRACGDTRTCVPLCGPCDNGACDGCGGTCRNDCGERQCGQSARGCSCGTCPSGMRCNGNGKCENIPPCVPRVCPKCSPVETDNGCGGKCPATVCPTGKRCNAVTGLCEDEPCVKRPCPPCALSPTSDGCGGVCPVAKGCDGRVCGQSSDGCVSSCGTCPVGKTCSAAGQCVDDGSTTEKDPMRYRPPRNLVDVSASVTPTQRLGYHALLFVNDSNENLYVGMISMSRKTDENLVSLGLEDLSGFLIPNGKAFLAYVPLNHSGRIWARSSCKWFRKPTDAYRGMPVDGLEECVGGDYTGCVLACDAGSCGAANGLAANYICGRDSGVPPVTLFEFTWGSNEADEDTWDISNVDGHNVGIRVDVIGGSVTPGRTAECQIGRPVEEWCPSEVLWRGTVNQGVNYCSSICKAMTDNAYEERADAASKQRLADLKQQKEPWSGGPMSSFLCCDCGSATGKCEDNTETPSSTCYYGCSPYQTNPFNAAFENRRCFAKRKTFEVGSRPGADGQQRQIGWSSIGMGKQDVLDGQLRDVPDWPAAGPPENPPSDWKPDKNWAEIFSDLCPQAYSWQFKDLTSTYHARGAVGYKITFLPRPGNA